MRRAAVLLVLPLLVVGAGCGGDDDDDAAASAGGGDFCDRATLVDERFSELENSFSSAEAPSPQVFEDAADTMAELADGAPDEIKDDLEVVADGVREIAEVLGEIDFSDPAALADPANAEDLQALAARMEELDERVGESSDRVEAYLRDECGLEIGDDGSDDGTSEGSDS